jgi:hypothetical protein
MTTLLLILATGIGSQITSEAGILENIQVAVLFAQIPLWVSLGFWLGKMEEDTIIHPFFAYAMAMMAYIFLARETSWLRIWDVDQLTGLPTKMIGLCILAIINMGLGVYWLKGVTAKKRETRRFFVSFVFRLIFLGGLWMTLGDAFDKKLFNTLRPEYYEEISETFGYVTLMLALLVTLYAQPRYFEEYSAAGRHG